jgi:hypothetical protein
MAYDTAGDVIETALAMCGLSSVADPYASQDDVQVQIRALLNQCGRELYAAHQWQQFVRTETISTGADPGTTHPDGNYDLPSDFGYFINQTGWTPTNIGMGLPLAGPLTEQQYSYLVATNLASSTIYVSFRMADGYLSVLPAPAPANIDITFHYVSNGWVDVNGAGTSFASKAENSDDIIMFEPVLISTMLALRYKQAKNLNSKDTLEQFQSLFSLFTGVNASAPTLNMTGWIGFPYLNPWTNIPQTGFGS